LTDSWREALDRASLDKDEIKAQLPLEWVVMEAGVQLERQPDGRLRGLCPFHDDSDPSFAIFGEDLGACGCWACDFGPGDLFDFIQRWRGVGFAEAVGIAAGLLRRMRAEGFTPSPPPPARQAPADLAERARAAWRRAQADPSAVAALVDAKGLTAPVDWLLREFWLGSEDRFVVTIPHLGPPEEEGGPLRVNGLKTRTARTHPYAVAGSVLSSLYGAWRDRGRDLVVLTEGESDTWEMAWRLRDRADVFGLPSGAAAKPRPEWAASLVGRDVVLMFDADRAGRDAARRWHQALAGQARSTRVARLEDGADASSAADPEGAVDRAVDVPPEAGGARVAGSGVHYVRNNEHETVISNWVLRPERLVEIEEGGFAIEGRLPNGRTAVISSDDLSSEGPARAWANRHGYVWLGSTKDAQSVLDLLLRDRPFLAAGRGTQVAGWHDGHFVLPGESVGPERWVYVPPPADPDLGSRVLVRRAPYSPEAARALLSLQEPGVLHPILAWVAAAPLRAMAPVFPPLGVHGTSGSGKTTLLEEVLRTFGWAVNLTLTGTTPHAVQTYASAANGVPVWFDEYRHGARIDARTALDQVLRDAWTGQASVKGGMDRANYARLSQLPARAPIIVSGEDMWQETSHVDRMQIVQVTRGGRDPRALDALRRSERAGFGRAYLGWLVDRYWDGTLPALRLDAGMDRQASGRAVLRWGWSLLRGFLQDAMQLDPGREPDLSGVERAHAEASSSDPIMDALRYGLEQVGRSGNTLARVDGDDVRVKVMELVDTVKRFTDIQLPGGTRAVKSALSERWGAYDERSYHNGMETVLPGAAREVAPS